MEVRKQRNPFQKFLHKLCLYHEAAKETVVYQIVAVVLCLVGVTILSCIAAQALGRLVHAWG